MKKATWLVKRIICTGCKPTIPIKTCCCSSKGASCSSPHKVWCCLWALKMLHLMMWLFSRLSWIIKLVWAQLHPLIFPLERDHWSCDLRCIISLHHWLLYWLSDGLIRLWLKKCLNFREVCVWSCHLKFDYFEPDREIRWTKIVQFWSQDFIKVNEECLPFPSKSLSIQGYSYYHNPRPLSRLLNVTLRCLNWLSWH